MVAMKAIAGFKPKYCSLDHPMQVLFVNLMVLDDITIVQLIVTLVDLKD